MTLLELLVVLAILAILFGLTSVGYAGFVQSSRVKEASLLISQRLNQAQIRAKKDNKRYTVTVVNTTTLRVTPNGGTAVDTALPPGTRFTATTVTALPTMNFDPPFGALSEYQTGGANVPALTVEAVANTAKTRTVKVITLLGDMVVQ